MMRGLMMLLAVSAVVFTGYAELKLPSVFSDGMVLQRGQEVPVWGWTDPGAEVTVSFAGADKTVQADEEGTFLVRLGKMGASTEPRKLRVRSGDETVAVANVLVGEVWLCSGQSNMMWPVSKSNDYEKERVAATYPLIRMFLAELTANIEPQRDVAGKWVICAPDTVGEFSAVAYFFGRDLREELDVPIGLIRSAWGGTRIEAWSSMESLEKFPSVMASKARADASARTFSEADATRRYEAALVKWNAAVERAKADGTDAPRRPRKRVHPRENQNYPANLYNAMIHPLVPFGMRGAIWYQGEANAKTTDGAALYRALLDNMLAQWRAEWGAEFPFYAVQLVNYMKPRVEPVEDTPWAFIRESFLSFHKEVPNAAIVVGIDVGEANDIHPKNKQAIGYRLARRALADTYGADVVAGGPVYTSMKKEGNQIILRFEDIGSGLAELDGAPLKTLAIAGADKKFVVAHAAIVDDTLVVSSEKVADPVAVRYAWADNPVGCNLGNKEGFPASPFRTDDWAPVARDGK